MTYKEMDMIQVWGASTPSLCTHHHPAHLNPVFTLVILLRLHPLDAPQFLWVPHLYQEAFFPAFSQGFSSLNLTSQDMVSLSFPVTFSMESHIWASLGAVACPYQRLRTDCWICMSVVTVAIEKNWTKHSIVGYRSSGTLMKNTKLFGAQSIGLQCSNTDKW